MTDAIPIFSTSEPLFVPRFLIRKGRNDLQAEILRDVVSVMYEDTLGETIDGFALTVNNWDAQRRRPKYFGYATAPGGSDRTLAETFKPGNEFQIWLGYGNELKLMTIGYVERIEATFPQGGAMTLRVQGFDPMKQFKRLKFSKVWRGKRDSEVAKELEQPPNAPDRPGINFKVRVSDEAKAREPRETIRMRNESVAEFLKSRARRRGYVLQTRYEVVGSTIESYLYFGPQETRTDPVYKLEWGKTLVEFKPMIDAARLTRVTVRGWNARTGRKIEASARLRDTQCNRDLHAYVEALGREETITDQVIEDHEAALRLARDTIRRHGCAIVKATGTTLGLPDLRAGREIEIGGTDYRFDGRYRLTKTTHTIDTNGYRTTFEGTREAPPTGLV